MDPSKSEARRSRSRSTTPLGFLKQTFDEHLTPRSLQRFEASQKRERDEYRRTNMQPFGLYVSCPHGVPRDCFHCATCILEAAAGGNHGDPATQTGPANGVATQSQTETASGAAKQTEQASGAATQTEPASGARPYQDFEDSQVW